MLFSDEYPELHHYTDWKGLVGILDSQSLWATQYDKLNDPSEIKHLSTLLKSELYSQAINTAYIWRHLKPTQYKKTAGAKSLEEIAVDAANGFVDSIYHVSFGGLNNSPPLTKPYIVSFCTHGNGSYEQRHGLLSQWRGYGARKHPTGDGTGFAIVFDSRSVEKQLKKESRAFNYAVLSIADVIYDNDYQKFNDESEDILNKIKFAYTKSECRDRSGLQELILPYLRTAVRYKHRAFKEEQESRISALPNMYPDQITLRNKPKKPILYRGEGIPYISLFGKEKLPIKRIIVGPSQTQQNWASIARTKTPTSIEITTSDTPFLG